MHVETGSQCWRNNGYNEIDGMKIGLVTNHTAVCEDGVSTLHAILGQGNIEVAKLFAPEHGAFGSLDAHVPDTVDFQTNLPIISLFGDKKKPEKSDLVGLDALVFEMQDIGARFYTYASTLGLCLESCAVAGIPLIVLDRPNPITGSRFEGPPPDMSKLSFTAYHTIPIRHGLTLGELARLYALEKHMENSVWVAPCMGWRRKMWFDQTGLAWRNPSPAMRSLTAAALYPGVCLLEQTNISVGRGTEMPFEQIGAPWISAERWLRALRQRPVDGVRFEPTVFTPTLRDFADQECQGIRVVLEDRERLNAVQLGITLIVTLLHEFPTEFNPSGVQNLLASKRVYDRLIAGDHPDDIIHLWEPQLKHWEKRIQRVQLYD
jgi:uncharacterized protein YbbC (DUF1343 family)